ncbi:hypothetical protein D3C81_1844020 [compost metagenome]
MAGLIAARNSLRLDRSTCRTLTPNSPMPWCSRAKVQPYRVRSTMISSAGRSKVQRVAAIAPMPELKATAASPFSRVAMRDSSSARVGLEIRV